MLAARHPDEGNEAEATAHTILGLGHRTSNFPALRELERNGRSDVVEGLRTTAIILTGAAVAAAVALAAMVTSSQPDSLEKTELIAFGCISATQIEGEVVSIDESSMTVRTDDGDVEIGCFTDTARWLKGRAVTGSRIWASYFVGNDGTTSLENVGVLIAGRNSNKDDDCLPTTSVKPEATPSDESPEGFSGGPESHTWPLRGLVVEVFADRSCVVMAADGEGAGILEPGLIAVVIDWSRPTLPSISEIEVGCSYEVRYMLPLLEPGYVVADTMESL